MKFMRWSCRALLTSLDDIDFLENYRPVALCLQKTHLILKCQMFNAAILFLRKVVRGLPRLELHLSFFKNLPPGEKSYYAPLKGIAVQILTEHLISVSSLCVPPAFTLKIEQIQWLDVQKPLIIIGYFSAPTGTWISRRRHDCKPGRMSPKYYKCHPI